jgi:hypothetical protein
MKYIWKQITMIVKKYRKASDSLRMDPFSYIDIENDFYKEEDNHNGRTH